MQIGRRILLILLVILPLASFAQSDSAPEGLENPRATLSTFFEAMNETPANTARAAQTLDLTQIPPIIQDTQGPSLSIQLLGIFNRTKFVDLDEVPNDPDGPEYTIPLSISINRTLVDLPPIIIRKEADGGWRFSAQTVENITKSWQIVKDEPVLGDLKDIRPSQSIYEEWAATNLSGFWLKPGFLGVINWKWLGLVLALAASYLAGLAVRIIVKLFLRLKTGKFGSELSKTTLDSAGHGVSLITNGTIFASFVRAFQLTPDVKAGALFLSLVVEVVGCSWLAIALVEFLINRLTPKVADSDRAERLFLPILRNLGRLIVIAIAVLFFLQKIGFDVTGLIAGLGIGGVVVALAAKDSVENLFGSFTLVFEMPFQIGDWIIADGVEGTVEEISLRSTVVRTFHDSTILVPNSKFIANPVENMGRRRYRRMKTTLGITYDATPDQVEMFVKSLREYILNHPKTWDDKIHIVFNDYGPSSLNILLYIFIDATDWGEELRTREEILLQIMRIAESCQVHFAFPTQKMIIDTDKSNASMRILTDE